MNCIQKISYIISNGKDIIGCFEKKDKSFLFLLDHLLDKLKFMLEIIKVNSKITLPQIHAYKITSIYSNSSIIELNIYFDVNKCTFFYNLTENINLELEEFKYIQIKINLIKSLKNKINELNNNELNIFIPNENLIDLITENNLQEIHINKISNKESNCVEVNNTELLKQKIEKLKKQKLESLNKITNEKKELDKKKNDLFQKRLDIINNLKKYEKKKEIIEATRRKFYADRNVYTKIKDQIETDDDIPDLFIVQYPIFKYIDENNIEDSEEQLEFYKEHLPKKIPNLGSMKYGMLFDDFGQVGNNIVESSGSEETPEEVKSQMVDSDNEEDKNVDSDELDA